MVQSVVFTAHIINNKQTLVNLLYKYVQLEVKSYQMETNIVRRHLGNRETASIPIRIDNQNRNECHAEK